MKTNFKLISFFYIIDLLILYIPKYLFPEIQLIEGFMGVNTSFFYSYRYVYVLIIALISTATYRLYFYSLKKYKLYKLILLLSASYFSLITVSLILYAISRNSLSFVLQNGVAAYVLGIFIIIYSPFTYIVFISNILIGLKYYKSDSANITY